MRRQAAFVCTRADRQLPTKQSPCSQSKHGRFFTKKGIFSKSLFGNFVDIYKNALISILKLLRLNLLRIIYSLLHNKTPGFSILRKVDSLDMQLPKNCSFRKNSQCLEIPNGFLSYCFLVVAWNSSKVL